jgi:hypothetical protein
MSSSEDFRLHLSASSNETKSINSSKTTDQILTALSSHKKCFICDSSKHLHRVKQNCIAKAFLDHRIIIIKNSRLCNQHIDKNGEIKPEEFKKIKTKIVIYTGPLLNVLNTVALNAKRNNVSYYLFGCFRDIENLDNEFCFKITKWTKKEFINFSDYITSINVTENRNKYQLVALYRYWLLKGADQETLSYLFGCTQREISHYLTQIRNAINKNFVPFFLGTTKEREFFLKRNTKTAKILFDLKDDDLAIVVDGTYTRIEKSANNDFQYATWSQQKLDLLIKPFIICCCDGYILDCYGPFKAHQNDASILKYILDTDNNLRSILLPDKTFILLDRGNFILTYY